ncbi:hypothetical protein B0H13DRAFT_214135 [Mycena leptocephala]|nr:hypothetical protein B0H13DRAFT_214135 [Mycena leptocephala]
MNFFQTTGPMLISSAIGESTMCNNHQDPFPAHRCFWMHRQPHGPPCPPALLLQPYYVNSWANQFLSSVLRFVCIYARNIDFLLAWNKCEGRYHIHWPFNVGEWLCICFHLISEVFHGTSIYSLGFFLLVMLPERSEGPSCTSCIKQIPRIRLYLFVRCFSLPHALSMVVQLPFTCG